ncbi:MAG: hypothetical protein IKN31_00585 [Bacteroidales bacterium]|nr:hypothetical protein [Bacteroidales bacterium]
MKKVLITFFVFICFIGGAFFIRSLVNPQTFSAIAIESLADDESEPDWGDHCRCKYGWCKSGNAFSFRKWCFGPQPGTISDCSLYNDGCDA